MTVLVTGGAGYVGSHMVHELVDAGERVVVLDNLATGLDWAVAKGASLVIGEVGDQPRVAALIAEHRVIVPDSVRDPLGYYRNNTVNSRALIESAVKGRVRHFIFSSTAEVYGNPERVPVREDDVTVPTSPYGSSKLMTEIMLRDAGSAHGLRHVIPALLQRRRRRPARSHRPVNQKRHPPHQGLARNRARPAAKSGCLRHRLPDTGRHLHPRLHSRVRSRDARIAMRWRICAAAASPPRSIAVTAVVSPCSK